MSGWTYVRGPCLPSLRKLSAGCAGLVLTDPPYGTGTDANIYGRRHDGSTTSIANDRDLSALEEAAPEMLRALAPDGVALVFMAPTEYREACGVLEYAGFQVHHSLPWDKGAPGLSYSTRFAYEDVILCTLPGHDPFDGRDPIVVPLRVPRVQQTQHPNEKPVELLRRFIRWALPNGGHVLDPFAGIASCGVAALLEGCTYTGMEIDPQWWDIAERRLNEVTDNTHGLGLFQEPAA